LQKRDHKTQDAYHKTNNDRDDRQSIAALSNPLALQDQQRQNDKGQNSHEPKAYSDSQGPWKPLVLQTFLD